MTFYRIIWDDPRDPLGNVAHIAQHGLDVEDVEGVLIEPVAMGTSRSTGLPVLWGYTTDGRYIIVVYEQVDEDTIRVITAYEVSES